VQLQEKYFSKDNKLFTRALEFPKHILLAITGWIKINSMKDIRVLKPTGFVPYHLGLDNYFLEGP
jgi:hypothetical protein